VIKDLGKAAGCKCWPLRRQSFPSLCEALRLCVSSVTSSRSVMVLVVCVVVYCLLCCAALPPLAEAEAASAPQLVEALQSDAVEASTAYSVLRDVGGSVAESIAAAAGGDADGASDAVQLEEIDVEAIDSACGTCVCRARASRVVSPHGLQRLLCLLSHLTSIPL
jgi:hypothetical protein